MLEIIFYTVWILNILSVIFKIKSKILDVVSFFILIIIFGGNTMNSDYIIYEREYYIYNSEFEMGYEIISQIALRVGLNYNQFLFAIGIICYSIVLKIFTKYSSFYAVFYTIYFSVFMFYDIIQVRNFICMTFLVVALDLLIERKRLLSFAMILLAAQFQIIAYIYIPLCILDIHKKRTKYFYRNCVLLIFLFCVFIFIKGNNVPLLKQLITYMMGEDSSKLYYLGNKVNYGFLVSYFLQFLNVILVYLCKQISKGKENLSKYKINFIECCCTINLYGFIAFPLVMVNHNFYRIFRNFCVFDIIIVGILFDGFGKEKKYKLSEKDISLLGYIFIFCILWRFLIMYKYSDFTQIETILNNNMFI